jgi:hypothetical protein
MDVRSRARRRDSDDDVPCGDPVIIDRARTIARDILGAFLGSRQRRKAAGDDALHHLRIGAEGRRAFARVEHAQPAGGARTDVEQAARCAKGFLDERDRARNRVALGRHRGGDECILGPHQIDDLRRAREIDGDRARIAAFGHAGIERGGGH